MHVLTRFGGLSKAITLFILILVIPIREVLYYRKLMNKTFNICVNSDQVKTAMEIMIDDDKIFNRIPSKKKENFVLAYIVAITRLK